MRLLEKLKTVYRHWRSIETDTEVTGTLIGVVQNPNGVVYAVHDLRSGVSMATFPASLRTDLNGYWGVRTTGRFGFNFGECFYWCRLGMLGTELCEDQAYANVTQQVWNSDRLRRGLVADAPTQWVSGFQPRGRMTSPRPQMQRLPKDFTVKIGQEDPFEEMDL